MAYEVSRDEFTVSDDPARLDLAVIHGFLTRSYWAEGRSLEMAQRSIDGSLPFGVYHGDRQVSFARVVTDRTTFAWLADVFVLEPYRGRGLADLLLDAILGHPELQGLRRWVLATRDAHGLYARHGWGALEQPERWMERRGDIQRAL